MSVQLVLLAASSSNNYAEQRGGLAPLFFESCVPSLRADASLNIALQALDDGDFASALIAAEYACRRFPNSSIAAMLRAQILHRCRPEMAARAWYFAWCIDPQDSFLQDALLEAWHRFGAMQSVRELAPLFLPARCKNSETSYRSLVDLITSAGEARFGVCWRTGSAIEGRIFAPQQMSGEHEKVRLIITHESQQFAYELKANGQTFKIDCPHPNGIWSVAFVDSAQLLTPTVLYGSPLSFSSVHHPIDSADLQVSSIPSEDPLISERKRVCILIPVYRGFTQVQACLRSVLQSLSENQSDIVVLVIDDASPEPAISKWLDDLAAEEKIILLRNAYNLGFIETVNRGLRHAMHCDADVLLLNADTLVHSDWVDRMIAALYSAEDIASVSPWSNNGEISSFPKIAVNNPSPNFQQLMRLDAHVATLYGSGQLTNVKCPLTVVLQCS